MVDEATQPPQPLNVANYRLGRVIGQGGWGVVYEAVNTRNDERVALKLLHAHLASDEAYLEPWGGKTSCGPVVFAVEAAEHLVPDHLGRGVRLRSRLSPAR